MQPPASSELTRLPLRQALLQLAIPLTGAMALETAFTFVNGFWVGKLGTDAFAALNVCSFSVWMLFALSGALSTGCNAVIAQRVGAGRHDDARRVAWLGVISALLWGAVLAVIMQGAAHQYLSWQIGHHLGDAGLGTTLALSERYLRCIFLFAPIFVSNDVLSSILRAHGDTATPLRLYAIGVTLNFLLDPLLMFSCNQGLQGSAYATGIGFSLEAALLAWVVGKRLGWSPPRLKDLGEVLRIGLPSSFSALFFCVIYILLTPVIAPYGASALAALGIGHRIESFSYLMSKGLSLAALTLVGQHLGAGNPELARQAAREALKLGVITMFVATLVLLFGAPLLSSVFTSDPLVLERATFYVRWMSLAQLTTAVSVILEGVMSGAGRPLLAVTGSTACAALRVPGARYGSQQLGLAGVWITMVASRALEAGVFLLVFWTTPAFRPRPQPVDPGLSPEVPL